jgi:hypothetical protein
MHDRCRCIAPMQMMHGVLWHPLPLLDIRCSDTHTHMAIIYNDSLSCRETSRRPERMGAFSRTLMNQLAAPFMAQQRTGGLKSQSSRKKRRIDTFIKSPGLRLTGTHTPVLVVVGRGGNHRDCSWCVRLWTTSGSPSPRCTYVKRAPVMCKECNKALCCAGGPKSCWSIPQTAMLVLVGQRSHNRVISSNRHVGVSGTTQTCYSSAVACSADA